MNKSSFSKISQYIKSKKFAKVKSWYKKQIHRKNRRKIKNKQIEELENTIDKKLNSWELD
jgi:hypothetical protein